MSWLTDIFSSSASAIVDSVGTDIDKLVTSDEEKLQLKNELVKIQLEATQKALDKQIAEAKACLEVTDFKMTVDYYATMTAVQQEELTAKRAEARAFLKEQGL